MGLVLVIGSGGREHALAWALANSPEVERVYIAPGNGGTSGGKCQNVSLSPDDFPGLLAFAQENGVDLTVVGPEVPLAAGIVDSFQAAGLRIFGPTAAAAKLEASKAFAKAFMREHGIPTGGYATFTNYESALHYVQELGGACVIKADGLAAGKGVTVCETADEAYATLSAMLRERVFGTAGATVLIEERLTGPELSVLAFCDGENIAMMPPARDHKRVFDGDQGANTGGMGVYAPVPEIDAALMEEIHQAVLAPTVRGMAARGTPYRGVLYAGLMLTPSGVRTLEFNCRFGDPETQAILPLLESDLYPILAACADGCLDPAAIRWGAGACATVILASPGYPGSYPQGLPISGLESVPEDVRVFHAGTAIRDGQIVTAGGRVLAVTGRGADLPAALERAYAGVGCIHFEGMHYRRDIGR